MQTPPTASTPGRARPLVRAAALRQMPGMAALAAADAASAQSVVLCGTVDQYFNDMHSSPGTSIRAVEDDDLSKRTMLHALADRIANGSNAGFRPAGSAGLPFNFSNPNDVNGRTSDGAQG